MSTKTKFKILALGVCIILGLVIYLVISSAADDSLSAARQTLRQAIMNAKKGDKAQPVATIKALGKGDRTCVSEELLSDYTSFLKDKAGEVQWLGARACTLSRARKVQRCYLNI